MNDAVNLSLIKKEKLKYFLSTAVKFDITYNNL